MTAVYVDTSGLLPLLDRDDRDHARVAAAVAALAAEGATLVTTSYVLVESGALVARRLGTEAFRRLGELVERAMDVVWVDEELHRQGWALAATGGRRAPSLVDRVSFLAMRELGATRALALDEHFRAEGFATLP